MRTFVRLALERCLLPLAGAGRRRQARSGGCAILSYHNVSPDGAERSGDVSLHLPLRSFLDQIDRLARTHRIVPLGDLAEGRVEAGDRPLAAITFDDAYRGAVELGVPALVERGIPATIFVAPGLLGEDAFWWDALARRDGAGLDPETRIRALEGERGRPGIANSPIGHLRSDQRPTTLADLTRIAELPGVSLGSHTWSHPNLTALEGAELDAELERPKAWLLERFPDAAIADHLAFPYGLWNERVAAAARRIGYRSLYRVEGGVAPPPTQGDHVFPRINVPGGVSGPGFALRVAGLM